MNSLDNKKVVNAWAMYDWANSVYPLVITSTIFPIYYSAITKNENSGFVDFFGRTYVNTALYSYAISLSFLVVALISPLLSGIADYSGNKKMFMRFFCYLGAISCSSLYFFVSGNIEFGIIEFFLASVGFSGSLVFYNSYLPEISSPSNQDKVSAKGYALGYIGSSILLIASLALVLQPKLFGITDDSLPARISFLLTGIWWIVFAQYSFRHLPSPTEKRVATHHVILNGYRELIKVYQEIKTQSRLTSFLLSFFFFNMGVQTVMYVAALYGDKELKLESGQLITTILIIQFVAIGGAYLFSFISSKLGNAKALAIAIVAWIGICLGALQVSNVQQFYTLAFFVGMVMGGIQSLSRSTYSKMLPETKDTTSYFSFFDVTDKMAIVLGTASYGLIEELTGSMKNSIGMLAIFFVIGLFFLFRIMKVNFTSIR